MTTTPNIRRGLRPGTLMLPILSLSCIVSPIHSAPKAGKPAAKPATSRAKPAPSKAPVVLGQNQMAGQNAQIGTTYTLGKDSPMNFTLRRAEFSIEAINYDTSTIVPTKDQKVLVLHFTAHNPMKEAQHLDWSSFTFTAVDALDNNHENHRIVAREGTRDTVRLALKPAQKIDVWTAILVPARVALPKLIVASEESGLPVLRFDLRGKVKGIAAPYADAIGTSVAAQVPAKAGDFNPLGTFAARLDKAADTREALNEEAPEESKRYLTAIFTLKNTSNSEQHYDWGKFIATLIDADGEKVEYNQILLKANRDERARGTLDPGEEAKVRFYFTVPEKIAGKTVLLREGEEGRTFAFQLPATP
jgi:hypothetical protein